MAVYESKEALYDVLDKVVAWLQGSDTFQQRTSRANTSVGFVVSDLGAEYALFLQEGGITGTREDASAAAVGVTLSTETLDRLLSGKLDGETAYMTGKLRLRGSEWVAQTIAGYLGIITQAYNAVAN